MLGIFIVATAALCTVAYSLDPQNVYRLNTNGVRFFNPTYSTAPAIRTAEYDCVIIGSSMVQNFDANEISLQFGCKPLKLAIGALEPCEMLWLYNCAQEQGKADKYIVNIDLHRFAASENVREDSGRFPEYMYKPEGIKQFRYLLGYETWFRFIPLQIMLTAVDALNIPLPSSFSEAFETSTDINKIGSWDEKKPPGEEALLNQFNRNTVVFNDTTAPFCESAEQNMEYLLTQFAEKLDGNEELTIYLPPCSSLYWAEKDSSELDVMFALREQIAAFASEHNNIHLCDLQAESYVTDLSLFMDASHSGIEIRKKSQQAVMSCEGEPSTQQIRENNEKIKGYAQSAAEKANNAK